MGMPTPDQLREFGQDGYTVVPDVLTEAEIALGLAEVDRIMAEAPPPDDHVGYHFHWFHDNLDDGPLGQAFLGSAAKGIIEALIAPHALAPNEVIQVSTTPPPWDHRPVRGHLDGLTPPEDDGRPGTFTLLAGLFLTDQSEEDMGNLWAWPGSHLTNAEFFTKGKSDEDFVLEPYPPADPQRPPKQITGKAGDMVLCNYLLSHNMGGNLSNETRKVIYFRVRTRDHRTHWHDCIREPLFEFGPVRDAMR